MSVDTLITGGTVVAATDTFDADAAIDGGEIVAVGDASSMSDATEAVDTEGLLVMPGMIDPHIHIDDMFSVDTHETTSTAAAPEGVASYIDFTWQTWTGELSIFEEGGTLLEGIKRRREKVTNTYIDYAFHGAIIREDLAVLSELVDAVGAGVSSFKTSTTYEHDLSNGFIHTVTEEIADTNAVGVYHTEDASLIGTLTVRLEAEGRGDPTGYLQSRPNYAEAMAAEDVVRMAQETGAKYYGIHAPCRKSAGVLSQFHGDGSAVRVETCTHYTTLTDDVFKTQGNLPMITPPIRKQDNVEAMFEHLADGTLDVVSADHCDYKRKSKKVGSWWDSTSGANALQMSMPVFHDEAVNERDFSCLSPVRVMSRSPAHIFGMLDKGTLDSGTDADAILLDPRETYTIITEDNASSTSFSIYEGRGVTDRVKKMFVRGKLIANDNEIVPEPGRGEYINRELLDWDA